MVALVKADGVDAVIEAMDKEFYLPGGFPDAKRTAARFASKPSKGAAVFVPEEEL